MSIARMSVALAASVLAAGALSAPAQAHHSFAMFDQARQVTVNGTVKEFQWTNPHAFIEVVDASMKACGLVHWNSFTVPFTVT